MWMSMTGFGRGETHTEEASITADVRSVNHRFLDIHVRCPAKFLPWETRIRGLVREAVSRGKVDVFLGVREWGRGGSVVRVNRSLLASFLEEIGALRRETPLPMDLTLRDLMAVPDLFVFAAEGADPAEALWPSAEDAVRRALKMLSSARRDEGERLRAVIGGGVARLKGLVHEVSVLSGENKTAAAARFRERIAALAAEAGVDPLRTAQESAYLIDRLDITEECDRLRSHIEAVEGLLAAAGESVGKRFDFLVQEIFRELNTAATKSAHTGISERIVAAKTELEKIREQIQNVE